MTRPRREKNPHRNRLGRQDQIEDNLRAWLGADARMFYDPAFFKLMPLGFCHPGAGKSGDLPPRPKTKAITRLALDNRCVPVRPAGEASSVKRSLP
jgi:hypothetical protein